MTRLACTLTLMAFASCAVAGEALEELREQVRNLANRVTELERVNETLRKEICVDRLVVRKELIVSDTEKPWEDGFDRQQIPRGIYARSLFDGPGGLWVRSRLIKGEIDDPFDDRFHALERDGRIRTAPGHISWNVWTGDAWRQVTILQGEGLDTDDMKPEDWSGGNHPGRLRIQSYRSGHDQPLTDALIGQGRMSLGGGGFGSEGLPYPREVLEIWGGTLRQMPVGMPGTPVVLKDDGCGLRQYAVIAVGSQGSRSAPSGSVKSNGLATLQWDSAIGADSYIILRDGHEITPPIRVEGRQKTWTDSPAP